jgi:hypothetical protein
LRHRVDAYNRNHSKSERISFDIFGPEKVIDLSNWTSEKRDHFFVYERDEYSSARVAELLDTIPDANASFPFYDGAVYHFAAPRGRRHISMLFSENLVDYILGHIEMYTDSIKEFYRGNLDTWFYYLSNIAVRDWQTVDHSNALAVDSAIKAWEEWRRTTNLDVVDDIATLQYFRRVHNQIAASDERRSTQ